MGSLKEKAKGVEEKHHFVKRSKTSIDHLCGDPTNHDDDNNDKNDTANKKENENEKRKSHLNNIACQTRSIIVSSWETAVQYTKKNQVIEHGVEGTGKGIEYLDGVISNVRGSTKKKKTAPTTEKE